jgi:ATP-dependent DNA helicase RecQ
MSTYSDTSPAAIPDSTSDILRRYWGFSTLRPLQAEAIACQLSQTDSLVVMPTGGGKSLCYQVPPAVEQTMDIVVSPLISLMKDQVDGLKEAGYPAAALYSGMTAAERRSVHAAIRSQMLRLLFVSPERLVTEEFLELLGGVGVRRIAIDEAHCISQWGHDFRPEYRQLAALRDRFPDTSVHAYTATATPRVREDIAAQLRLRDPAVLVGIFDRPNLIYRILPKTDMHKQAADAVARHAGEAVIAYCLSRKETEELAEWLSKRGVKAAAYHAGLDAKSRHRTQEAFANETLDVVVATVAFGMGIDRSNVRCVIHTSLPKTVENYQQETGRAGRDGLEAECVLFYSAGDVMRWRSITEKNAAEAGLAPDVVEAQKKLQREMERFCSSATCRHRALTEYFGQTYLRDNCGACDVCLDEVEVLENSQVLAQMILSCVGLVDQRFGIGHVVDVLLGAETDTIIRLGHQQLSVYGLLRGTPKPTATSFTYQLIDQSLLTRTEGDRPILKLNEASWDVMRGTRQARLVQPKTSLRKRTKAAERTMAGVDDGLFAALRQWRREAAAAQHIPPFMVFSDATLAELARARPFNTLRLTDIPGIGEKKAAQWGASVSQAVADYCRAHGLPPGDSRDS